MAKRMEPKPKRQRAHQPKHTDESKKNLKEERDREKKEIVWYTTTNWPAQKFLSGKKCFIVMTSIIMLSISMSDRLAFLSQFIPFVRQTW